MEADIGSNNKKTEQPAVEAPPPPQNEPVQDKVQAGDKPANQGGIDVTNLLGGIKNSIKAIDVPSWLPSAESLLGGGDKNDKNDKTDKTPKAEKDKAPDAVVVKALDANKMADRQDALHSKMLGKHAPDKLEPGEHKNENGSSFKVGVDGKITELKTAPSKEFPNGMHYKNIKYDPNGEMSSYEGPSGHRFTRRGGVDKNGMGTWDCTDQQNRYAHYAGAKTHIWSGKAAVDENGFHTMINSGVNRGAMFTRGTDGATIESRSVGADGLKTKITNADGSEAARDSRRVDNKIVADPQIRLKDVGKAETRVAIDPEKGTGKLVEPPKAEKPAAPAMPKEVEKIAEKMIKQVGDSPNPIGDLTKALDGLDNLNQASITRRRDGKHDVEMHFNQVSWAAPPNINVRGFRPNATRIDDDIKFTLSQSPNGIHLENMQGFSGSVTGPRGRVRPSTSNAMSITTDRNGNSYLDATSTVPGPFRDRTNTVRIAKEQLPPGSPIRGLMDNPDALREAAGGLRLFQKSEDLTHASIKRTGKDAFEVNTHAREGKHVEVNQKLGETGATLKSVDIEKNMSAAISHDATGARLSNIKGMTVKLDTGLGELKVTPRSAGIETNKEGVQVVRLEVEFNGTIIPHEIPVSKLRDNKRR